LQNLADFASTDAESVVLTRISHTVYTSLITQHCCHCWCSQWRAAI